MVDGVNVFDIQQLSSFAYMFFGRNRDIVAEF